MYPCAEESDEVVFPGLPLNMWWGWNDDFEQVIRMSLDGGVEVEAVEKHNATDPDEPREYPYACCGVDEPPAVTVSFRSGRQSSDAHQEVRRKLQWTHRKGKKMATALSCVSVLPNGYQKSNLTSGVACRRVRSVSREC